MFENPLWGRIHIGAFLFVIIPYILCLWIGIQIRIREYQIPEQFPDTETLKLKYILFWTPLEPIFNSFEDEGLNTFIENNCEFTNCIVTTKRKMLADVKEFDAIVFSAYGSKLNYLPRSRSPHQKYIMASLESPTYFTMKSDAENPIYFFNNYFNWTWTYRLDSDIPWRYLVITNLNGKEIGPKIDMDWAEHLYPVSEEIKNKLSIKRKAAAWMVSNCATWSHREMYVRKLLHALKKHNLTLELYGKCAGKTCKNRVKCAQMLQRIYYFYLAFENSFDEDYVTEKVVTAMNSLTVPVVFGGANYSRFLPPGSYLDARNHTPEKLAEVMRDIIANFSLYQDFFRWTNNYVYKEAHRLETCNLCKALNDETMVKNITIYKDMKEWWTGRQRNVEFENKHRTLPPIFTKITENF